MTIDNFDEDNSITAKYGLWLGVFVPWLDMVLCETLGTLQSDYHPFTHFISELGEDGRSTQKFMAVWWTLYTLLLLPMCLFLFRTARRLPWMRMTAVNFSVFAVSNGFLNAIFPCDSGCQGQTFQAKLHLIVSGVAFVMMVSLPLQTSLLGREHPNQIRLARISALIAAGIILLSIVLCAVQLNLSFVPESLIDIKGLLQRLRGSAFAAWISMLAINGLNDFTQTE